MGPKEKLAALIEESKSLLAKQKAGTFTPDDADRAIELAKERDNLQEQIDKMDAAAKALGAFREPAQDREEEGQEPAAAKDLGSQFVNSAAYKQFKGHNDGRVAKGTPIEIRAIDREGSRFAGKLLTTTDSNPAPVRTGEVDDLVYRPERRLLDVITRGTTDLTWFEYRQIISKTNNAGIVPEATTSAPIDGTTVTNAAGGLKPLSSLVTKTAQAKAHTYADGMEVTNQELADDGIMRALINSTLAENLEIELENILLNGAGTDDEPAGILNTTGVLQQAFVTDAPTSIRKAITKLRTTSGAQIKGVLLNPEDDEAWDLLKDADGRYMFAGGPYSQGPATAWGFERIVSQSIPVGQALIGDFSTIHLLQKDPLEILAFNQHKDFAQRNLTYIRAELRALQLIRNAAKLAVVDLTA